MRTPRPSRPGGSGSLRIIAGALKGRRLDTPSWDGLRPTSDRLRETLFNVLGAEVRGARVLDGYAGTGALGIEAISRGASHVTFVERDPRAEMLAAIAGFAPGSFDLVLLDPPYASTGADDVLGACAGSLADAGLLVLEHAARRGPAAAPGLVLARSLTAGDSALALYRKLVPARPDDAAGEGP